jgi:predicted N-acetyltransferase YhbS
MADGPRALGAGEWDQLNEVVSTVFRAEMFQEYPQLFNEANRDNLRVVAEDGKIVCHVGMTERPATLAGCRIDVACIGAVSTLEAYRGRGFASLAFQDACAKAAGDGIDLMLISGGRGLYTRVGCRQVGQDWDCTLGPAEAARLAQLSGVPAVAPPAGTTASGDPRGERPYRLDPLGPEQIDQLSALYRREPVRFLRPLQDWQMAFDCGVVMNTRADFWGLWRGQALLAYLVVHQPHRARPRPDGTRVVRVVEFAGERPALAGALPALLEHYGVGSLSIHVQGGDTALRTLLSEGTGREGTVAPASGTLRVINFPQLMERCRPLLAERLGAVAAELTFEADAPAGSAEGGFTIRTRSDPSASLRLPDLGSLATYLFGSPQPQAGQAQGSPHLAATLAPALPLPALWYGINYV